MGNQILKEYDIDKEPIGSAGVGLNWKIFSAKNKKTSQHAAIHILEKRSLPKCLRKESFYSVIRHSVACLSRLRHPHILHILHPLDESRNAFVMVTQPIVFSLANLMGDHRNIPNVGARLAQASLSQLDIKTGIRQLTEALVFCHGTARIYHNYVDPCNVYVSPRGDWKLGGFYYAAQTHTFGESVPHSIDYSSLGSPEASVVGLPSLRYASNEVALGEGSTHHADAFSLGRVAHEVHRAFSQPPQAPPKIENIAEFSRFLTRLHPLNMSDVPSSLQSSLKQLLAIDPQERLELPQFLSSNYFNDLQVRTLRYLENLLEKDLEKRIEFLKQLPRALNLFDQKTLNQRVLPPLLLQLKDETLAVFAIPSIMIISKDLEKEDFSRRVLPAVGRLMHGDRSPQFFWILLKHLMVLMSKSSKHVQDAHILPMVERCLDSKHVKVVQEAVKQLVECTHKNVFSFRDLKEKFLPRICRIAVNCRAPLPVRVASLKSLGEVFVSFDTPTIMGPILGAIDSCLKADVSSRQPAVTLCCVGVYNNIAKHLGANVSALRVLPALCPLLVDDSLNADQFQKVLNICRQLLDQVEAPRLEAIQRTEVVRKHQKGQTNFEEDVFDQQGGVTAMKSLLTQEFGEGHETRKEKAPPLMTRAPQQHPPPVAVQAAPDTDFDFLDGLGASEGASAVIEDEFDVFSSADFLSFNKRSPSPSPLASPLRPPVASLQSGHNSSAVHPTVEPSKPGGGGDLFAGLMMAPSEPANAPPTRLSHAVVPPRVSPVVQSAQSSGSQAFDGLLGNLGGARPEKQVAASTDLLSGLGMKGHAASQPTHRPPNSGPSSLFQGLSVGPMRPPARGANPNDPLSSIMGVTQVPAHSSVGPSSMGFMGGQPMFPSVAAQRALPPPTFMDTTFGATAQNTFQPPRRAAPSNGSDAFAGLLGAHKEAPRTKNPSNEFDLL